MRLFAISAFIILQLQIAKSQDYVVTNSGDTLYGEIKKREAWYEYLNYSKVTFKDDGQKTVYGPDDLKCYKIDSTLFETQDIGKGKRHNYVFMKKLLSGYCTLFEYEYAGSTIVLPPNNSDANALNSALQKNSYQNAPTVVYYLEKAGESPHEYWFAVLKNGKDLYFVDDPQLTFDLRHGKYKRDDVQEIVRAYNLDKQKQGGTP